MALVTLWVLTWVECNLHQDYLEKSLRLEGFFFACTFVFNDSGSSPSPVMDVLRNRKDALQAKSKKTSITISIITSGQYG
jgi:hypothetical protein